MKPRQYEYNYVQPHLIKNHGKELDSKSFPVSVSAQSVFLADVQDMNDRHSFC